MISPRLDRRGFLASGAALSAMAPVAGHAAPAGATARVTRMRVAMRDAPLGIDDTAPMLSWVLEGGTQPQTAYRIRVASSAGALAAGDADLWDSGMVASSLNTGVAYAGKPLAARQRCYWQVELATGSGGSVVSEIAHWEMGLNGSPDEWHGDWLAVEDATERADRIAGAEWVEMPVAGPDKPREFRLRFTSAAGQGVFFLASDGMISGLAIDGRPLVLPARDPNAFGPPPALRIETALVAGEHELTLQAAPLPGFFVLPTVRLAGQLRVPGKGATLRVTSGWQSRAEGQAEWADVPAAERQGHFPWPPTPARLFRRAFALDRVPTGARIYVSALGGYRIWINGKRVGSDELQSEPALYAVRVPYRVYDVSALLQPGENVVAAMIGDGFFASYQAPDGRYAHGPAPRRFRLMLEMGAASGAGAADRIVTDGRWRHRMAPVTMSEIYAGEDQDLRLWPDGWNAPGFDDAAWAEAWAAPAPDAAISAPLADPVRIIRTLAPASVLRQGDHTHLVDFGQNFAGRVRLRIKGARGQAIRVRHAERLGADGRIDQANLRAARAADHYTLAGRAEGEVLEPFFTYQGFRYAEIEGPSTLEADMVEGLALSSDMEETGLLRIGDPTMQKFWLNTLWSQRSNFVGIPTDCPQRDERLGWTGDAQVFWSTASFNMQAGAFTRDFTRLLRDNQGAAGAFPLWAPNPSGLGWGTQSPTPGWADAGVMLPYVGYLHSGDRSLVDENWDAMAAYVDGVLGANPDGIWREGRGADLGDWLSLDAKFPGDATTPKDLIATAMLARSAAQMAAMARWTGRDAQGALRQAQFERIAAAFADAFAAPGGLVGNGSQTGYILAIALGLLPPALERAAGQRLAAAIRDRGTLLTTGFLGTPLALDALLRAGEPRLAGDLLLRREYPSWGNMVLRGATTIWERWDGDTGDVAMNSFNHYALGSVCSFLYRRLAGIDPVEPGFARIRVAPMIDPRIGSAGAAVDSVRGRIEAGWTVKGGMADIELTLPPGVTAQVMLDGIDVPVGAGRHRWKVPVRTVQS